MKKNMIFFACLFSIGSITAQRTSPLALNAYGSYIFKDKLDFDGFNGYANEGFQYGVGLEYFIEKVRSVELKYLRQDTRFPLYGSSGNQLNEGKDQGLISYVLLSGYNYFQSTTDQVAVPYAGFGAGIGILDSDNGESSVKFAWDIKLGLQIKTASQISFKLQATLQSISSAVGNDFYYTPIGTVALPDYATLFQFGLGGGLCYHF